MLFNTRVIFSPRFYIVRMCLYCNRVIHVICVRFNNNDEIAVEVKLQTTDEMNYFVWKRLPLFYSIRCTRWWYATYMCASDVFEKCNNFWYIPYFNFRFWVENSLDLEWCLFIYFFFRKHYWIYNFENKSYFKRFSLNMFLICTY